MLRLYEPLSLHSLYSQRWADTRVRSHVRVRSLRKSRVRVRPSLYTVNIQLTSIRWISETLTIRGNEIQTQVLDSNWTLSNFQILETSPSVISGNKIQSILFKKFNMDFVSRNDAGRSYRKFLKIKRYE